MEAHNDTRIIAVGIILIFYFHFFDGFVVNRLQKSVTLIENGTSKQGMISDQACIQKVLAGEKNEFRHLVKQYENKAYNLAVKVLKDPESAMECVQASFVKAYESLASFRQESQFSTWFYRIVYNTCISCLRYDQRYQDIPEGHTVTHFTGEEVVTEGLDQEDLAVMMQKAYGFLHPEEIFIIEQYYREEATVDEIADMTGLSKSNVKIRLFRTRKKLLGIITTLYQEEVKTWIPG